MRSSASVLPDLPSGARVLVIRLRSLGDTLLATPALRALKQWRPDLRLSLLLYRRFAPIVDGNPDLDDVIALNLDGLAAPLELPRVVGQVRRRRFAACFNLHGGTLSVLLTRASGARHRFGFARFRFPWVYTARVDPRTVFGRERLHAVENQITLFYAAGLPPAKIPPMQIFPQPVARALVVQKLAAGGVVPGTRYAVVHPVARLFTEEWPFERYGQLARWLAEEHGLVPVLHGGPAEEGKLDAVARAYAKPIVRMEGLTVSELIALIEGTALFVGNDSGPAHIATALRRPAVILFGSMDSAAWGPWPRAAGPQVVVQNYFPCNPCKGDRCYAFAQPECILSITVEQVRAAVERVLAATRSPVAGGD